MTHTNQIYSLLAIGMLAAILAQQTSMAQSTPPEGTVNSPGSVLHGRTTRVADRILLELGPSITQYNQVTDLLPSSAASLLCTAKHAASLPCKPTTSAASSTCER